MKIVEMSEGRRNRAKKSLEDGEGKERGIERQD